ncbi:MAG TPA: cytochrome c peroxidase [Saprospiraceae bacterium]|nr:cytochrome c peroxidase [Saprospiraceae bacterium]
MIRLSWVFILLISFLFSCSKEEISVEKHFELMEIPKGFDAIQFPADNLYSKSRWELGKKLFYDPILSSDKSISCASCHLAEYAFSDKVSVSQGVEARVGTRNAPSLANVAFHPYYLREGGVPTLEMQVLVPIQEHNEFDFNILLIAERMNQDVSYVEMALEAYDRIPDAFVITRAIATFERSLISGYSPYDKYENYNDQSALNENEIRGMNLFFSDRLQCSQCHSGFNFTNYSFENNGLYDEYSDSGRFRLTGKEEDFAKFKTPSLRNIALTAPYMHDGSMSTLDEVIDHYNTGGAENPQKSSLIKPLHLSESEKEDLKAFLNSLTDKTFITNTLIHK